MYNTILFDLDGTLTDPKEGITKCVQYALKYFDINEPNLDELKKFIGPPLKESFMVYYHLDEVKAEQAIEKYRERFSTVGLFENGVYEGIEALLKALKIAGKKLAVATSKPTIYSERILEHYGLRKYFEVVVGSELDGTRVNKAEVICEVLKQLNIDEKSLNSVVMIGDRKHDILGAKACQLTSIGVKFGYAEIGELEAAGADYVAESVEALQDYLLKN